MIRSLCLLKFLTKFDVVNALFRESRFNRNLEEFLLIEHQDVSICIDFIKEQKTELSDFKTFILQDANFEKCGLKGLMNAAEEEIMFNVIKEKLKIFKRTRVSKISTLTQLDYTVIMKILKKKVLEGEINVKYDEAEDIIEVIDADPGLKEKVKKTPKQKRKIALKVVIVIIVIIALLAGILAVLNLVSVKSNAAFVRDNIEQVKYENQLNPEKDDKGRLPTCISAAACCRQARTAKR